MFTLGQEHIMEEASKPQPIMFTGGAIPVLNRKGEVSMEKVHVRRYVAGKRPDWANEEEQSSDEENDKFGKTEQLSDEEEMAMKMIKHHRHRFDERKGHDADHGDDRRLRRLRRHEETVDSTERIRRRRIHEPEVIAEERDEEVEERKQTPPRFSSVSMNVDVESSSDEDLDEEEIENRREKLRQRARSKRGEEEEELLALPTDVMKGEEDDKEEEEFTSEEESEYSDSEDDDGPRLKPVFVRKKDRLTIQEREKEEEKQRLLADEAKRAAEERRRYTITLVEKEKKLESETAATGSLQAALDAVDSDEGNDEAEYESWKVRELKRIKRDRDERDSLQREKEEVDKLRNMTEEERRAFLRVNPKHVTNQLHKGKYRFLQKYYHRGAFFMEKEDETYSRDFTAPTLEDHFDKESLPKVMQVKNFGRSGRTKYTHLADQDTNLRQRDNNNSMSEQNAPHFDSPWTQEGTVGRKVHAGMKQVFERPSGASKKRKNT